MRSGIGDPLTAVGWFLQERILVTWAERGHKAHTLPCDKREKGFPNHMRVAGVPLELVGKVGLLAASSAPSLLLQLTDLGHQPPLDSPDGGGNRGV